MQRWSIAAIYCYQRGCKRKNCYYSEQLETHCRMKQTVIELVKLYGIPKEKLQDDVR
ncbi:MAG: hypothetical protein Q4E83_03775 [bacterium]|nr:hypothetical protein [bacterium]